MRFALTVIYFATTLFFTVSVAADTHDYPSFKIPGVLNVISYSEFTPISYGSGLGYEADLLKAIAKQWHVKINFYPETIYEGMWRLPSRPYTNADIAIGGFTPALYRKKEGTAFSIMTTCFSQSLLVRKSDYTSGRIISYRSFKHSHFKIGVVPGTTGAQYAYHRGKEYGLPTSVFVNYPSESALLPALEQGKIDAIARGEIGNEYQALRHHNLKTIAKKTFHEGFSIAINESNKPLVHKVNQAIREITDHGKITYAAWLKNHKVFEERVAQLSAASGV